MKNNQSSRDLFALELNKSSRWDFLATLPNRGVFAVWTNAPSVKSEYRDRLFVAGSLKELQTRLKSLTAPIRIFVETAASKEGLFNPERERRLLDVLLTIDQFRSSGDIEALKRVRAAVERKGVKPGPHRDPGNSRWKIEILMALARNPSQQLKSLVKYPRRPKSASAEIGRFCQDVYKACILGDGKTPEARQKLRVLSESFGFKLDRERSAVELAYQRGEKSFEKIFPANTPLSIPVKS